MNRLSIPPIWMLFLCPYLAWSQPKLPVIDSMLEGNYLSEAAAYMQLSQISDELSKEDKMKLALRKSTLWVLQKKHSQALELLDSIEAFVPEKSEEQLIFYYNKANALRHIGKILEAMVVSNNYLELAKTLKHSFHLGKAYNTKGRLAEEQADLFEAKEMYEAALEIFVKLENNSWQASVYQSLGIVARRQYMIEEAVNYYLKAAELYQSLNNYKGLSGCCSSLGVLLAKNESYPLSIRYFKKAIKTLKSVDEMIAWHLAMYQNNIGLAYKNLEQYDSAFTHLYIAVGIYKKIDDYKNYAFSLNNLGLVHFAINDLDSSLHYYQLALKIKTENQLSNHYFDSELGLAKAYLALKELDSCQFYLQRAHKSALQNEITTQLYNTQDLQAQLMFAKGDYKTAYELVSSAKDLKDSLYKSQRIRAQAEADSRLNIQLKNKENEFLKEKLKEEKENAKMRQKYLGSLRLLATILVVLLVILIWFLRTIYISRKNLQTKQRDLQKANDELLRLDNEKTATQHVIAHDLRSPLAQLKGLIELITMEGLTTTQKSYLDKAEGVFNHSFELIDNLIFTGKVEDPDLVVDLEELDAAKLLTAVNERFNHLAKAKKIQIKVEVQENFTINTDQLLIQRVLDNLVNNAIKYSPFETLIELKMLKYKGLNTIAIKDQGPGFTAQDQEMMFKKFKKLSARPTGGEYSSGLGLSIVHALCQKLKIQLQLESTLQKGSTFYLGFESK